MQFFHKRFSDYRNHQYDYGGMNHSGFPPYSGSSLWKPVLQPIKWNLVAMQHSYVDVQDKKEKFISLNRRWENLDGSYASSWMENSNDSKILDLNL